MQRAGCLSDTYQSFRPAHDEEGERRGEEVSAGEKDAGKGGCAQLFVTMCSLGFDTTRVSVLTKIPVQISNSNHDGDGFLSM